MLIYFRAAIVLVVALLSCLASAYSTLFLTEGVDKEVKIPAADVTTIQKTGKNETTEKQVKNQGIEVEVIPIVTDVFTQAEDLFNMTPLKLVAAISAQHLLTTVNNIPVAGNSYVDSLDMLEGVVNEFNKTAEIIKLTAKYVNISGHYILSILKEFAEESCDVKHLDEDMKSVRKNFLKTITEHAIGAVKELNEKTRQREMTGSDILVSSSYHIVSAFQEMTNQVLTLAAESKKKCKATPLGPEQKTQNVLTFQPVPMQGKTHKSIKKYEAKPKIEEKGTQTIFSLFLDQGRQDPNKDLKVEAFSPKTVLNTKISGLTGEKENFNQLKVPENMALEYIPPKTNPLFKNSRSFVVTEAPKEGLVNQETFTSKKLGSSQDQVLKNFNNQDLTIEVFSPDTISNTDNTQLSNHKNGMNKIEVPTELKVIKFNPLDKISLFENSKSGLLTEPSNSQIPLQKSENQFQISDDLTVEYPPQTKEDLKMSTKSNSYDRELDSAAVDSLSNVPWSSRESKNRDLNKDFFAKATPEKPKIEQMNIIDLLQSSHQDQNQQQQKCDEHLEPVCCFDENNNKFIIFFNDCKREEHNRVYQTSYSPIKMDTCVGLFLRDPKLFSPTPGSRGTPHKTVDMRPR